MEKTRRLMAWAGVFIFCLCCSKPVEAARTSTNMEVLEEATRQAIREGLREVGAGEADGRSLALSASHEHEGNWFVEHLLLDELTRRGFRVRVDSTDAVTPGSRLSFQIIALQVNYLGQRRRGLFGDRIIARSAQAELSLELVDDSGRIVSLKRSKGQVLDRFPADRLSIVEHPSYAFARDKLDGKKWTRFLEPVTVSAVVGTLIWILYSNR
ncbi:MAG: hypothetical protein J7M27_02595 [Candidatus Latescibacteria bacterium]|nr:hypothetical protein [Candidatus Latescibacterota bacterium]